MGILRSVEFGTSVFKRKTQYPVGRLLISKLPGWMRLVVAFVVTAKDEKRKYLFK